MNQELSLRPSEARRVGEELARSVKEPPFTKSWSPHSHAKVLDATANAVAKLGLKVKDKLFSLSRDGLTMMSLWILGKVNGKLQCLGIGNSMNKRLSLRFIDVATVMKCTNQIANGKFIIARKHTSMLTVRELSVIAKGAVARVVEKFKSLNKWHEDLKNFKLRNAKAERLTIRAMRSGVLAPSKFEEFDRLYFGRNEKPEYPEENLYDYHGALTQIVRDHNLITNMGENKRIFEFIESVKN